MRVGVRSNMFSSLVVIKLLTLDSRHSSVVTASHWSSVKQRIVTSMWSFFALLTQYNHCAIPLIVHAFPNPLPLSALPLLVPFFSPLFPLYSPQQSFPPLPFHPLLGEATPFNQLGSLGARCKLSSVVWASGVKSHTGMDFGGIFCGKKTHLTAISRPPVRSNGRSYKMLVMFFFLYFFFFATRSQSSLDRSPWNFATWSESGLIL